MPTWANDIVMLAFEPSTGAFWVGRNGVWTRDPATQTPNWSTAPGNYWPQIQGRNADDGGSLRSLPSQFSYPIPSNAVALGAA